MDIRRICLPSADGLESLGQKSREGGTAAKICLAAGALLIILSAVIHVFIIMYVADSIKTQNGAAALMSLVLPGFTPAQADGSAPPAQDEHPGDAPGTVESTDSPARDLSATGENGFSLKNETSYNPDLQVLYNSPNPVEKADKLYERFEENSPLVLLLHSHGTESYSDTNDSGSFRTSDPERSVVAVGEVLAKVLREAGISCIHLTDMFDAASYTAAYDNSAAAVRRVLEEPPSVQYIFDIHRDSIADKDGSQVAAVFNTENGDAAQLMFVVGTDAAGSTHTGWRQNLTVALHLQKNLYSANSKMMRPLNLQAPSFYQGYRKASLLLEAGTCGNTLLQAKRSAVMFGDVLADYILGRDAGLDVSSLTARLCK